MINNSISPFEAIRQKSADIILNSTDLLVINSNIVGSELKSALEDFRNHRQTNLLSVPAISAENELGLSLFFNSVNFCYRDPASGRDYQYTSRDGRQLRRSSAFFTSLVESGLDWNEVKQAESLSPERWKDVLQLKGSNVLYLGLERRERIVGLAGYLSARGFNRVTDFISSCRDNALELIKPLRDCGFFQDEFLKRAQVGIKMMYTVLTSRMGRSLKGMDLLTCMADYRIPQVFYNLSAVELAPQLRHHLVSEKPVISGSREELVLRASVIVIGHQLADLMGINEAEVDTLLWEYSQVMVKDGRMKIPHMLVATDKY
jgi:hypothetical protein